MVNIPSDLVLVLVPLILVESQAQFPDVFRVVFQMPCYHCFIGSLGQFLRRGRLHVSSGPLQLH